eukprot:304572-Lingulodinium_polyedra.AAC.1
MLIRTARQRGHNCAALPPTRAHSPNTHHARAQHRWRARARARGAHASDCHARGTLRGAVMTATPRARRREYLTNACA